MSVRAKFFVEQSTQWGSQQGPSSNRRVVLKAVGDDKIPENQRYHKYTPSGEITLSIDNPPAAEFFTPGRPVYVDFAGTESSYQEGLRVTLNALEGLIWSDGEDLNLEVDKDVGEAVAKLHSLLVRRLAQ